MVTDLGLAVRSFRGGLLAWVNSLSGATPVTNAAVTVYARNNQVLARGVTDEQGKVLAVLPDHELLVVVAEAGGGDLTYLDLEAAGVLVSGDDGGAAYLQPGEVEAAVFTERGIHWPVRLCPGHRPGRPERGVPEPFPVLLWVNGRTAGCTAMSRWSWTRRRRPRETAAGLLADGALRLRTGDAGHPYGPVGARRRPWRTSCRRRSAWTEAPPEASCRRRAALRPGRSPVRAARRRAENDGDGDLHAAPFAPENWKGWYFGDGEKDFAPIHKPIGAGALDADGGSRCRRKARRRPAQGAAGGAGCHGDGDQRARSVTACWRSADRPVSVLCRPRPGWEGAVRAGETQRVAVAEVRPDGEPVAEGKPLILTLSRVTWNSVLRRNREGRYEWTSERQVVEVRQDTLAAGGVPADWAFAVPSPGVYTLAAADPESGTAARIEFWAASSDPSWAAWSREKPGRVELAWDRERYRPGDTARLQVRAPFAGPALLTIETDRIHETRVVELAGNTAELEIAVDEELAPNAWCTLSVIRPAQAEAVWNAHRAIGTLALPVERPDRRMQVELAAPERIRPKTPLAGTVSVRDETGQPARGRVTVLAVDEAICLLTDYETPDPLTAFTARRGRP